MGCNDARRGETLDRGGSIKGTPLSLIPCTWPAAAAAAARFIAPTSGRGKISPALRYDSFLSRRASALDECSASRVFLR